MNSSLPNFLIGLSLPLLLLGCGGSSDPSENGLSIKFSDSKKAYAVNKSIEVSLQNQKNLPIDSVVYSLDGDRQLGSSDGKASILIQDQKLGKRNLTATVFTGGNAYDLEDEVTLLSSEVPSLFTYEILESYPHDMEAYTQGLEFGGELLFESTGQYGESSIRQTRMETGEVIRKTNLKDKYFGEGLTVLNNKVYQLTWRENIGYIYNQEDLQQTGTFVYGQSKEGWGLCNDGQYLYKSDGTERIWRLDPETLAEIDYIEIYTHSSKIPNVNELEWVDGKIYANRYEKDAIAIVNPETGAVEGVIDLKGLKDEVTQHPELNVLNGIAYKGEPGILYVTGKNWDRLFKIRVVPR
ncbi:glutaminyl-peptide cyclotransferase [Aureitalea marina]|uniref:Glutamine cyclotransferase n=1 Tax=Aureitalea marina TaxID=930804 RepID=A0A2S7KN48_9FLAO|nr:glutaminyl-peptide cyclotransferase [Aureitalea marina]PQB04054.1 glutamine cyclotransferase [Aureitalea marina]